MRQLLLAAASLAFVVTATPSFATPCRDTKGKFAKCAPKPVRCRNVKGKYAKCGTSGAHPA